MCDKTTDAPSNQYRGESLGALKAPSSTLYELKQKREYLYAQLSIIQKAIEAVNLADNF